MSASITLALRTAQSGLLTNQQALNAIANNVANVNTPGYSRKIVNLEQRVLAGSGSGVQLAEITRVVDEGLLKSLRLELSAKHALTSQKSYYERIQESFGKPADNNSISHILSDLTTAIEALAAAPDKTLEQSELVRQGNETTLKLQSMSATLQELRLQADGSITEAVEEINVLTTKIADLNDKIIRNNTVSADVSDLRDQRDQAVDRLAQLIDIRYFYRGDGDLVVFTSGGRTLVDNVGTTMTHNAASSANATATHAEGDFGGIYLGPPIPGNDITNEIRGGELKGLIDQRDRVLTDLQSQIDELAATLRDTFNQIHNRGMPFPGMQSMTGTRRFLDTTDPANAVNQTITLDPTNSADDVALVLFDDDGNQTATTTLNAIMTDPAYGSGAQPSHGPWSVSEVADTMEDWLQANGAAGAAVGLTSDGRFSIELNTSGTHLAFRDQEGSGPGSTHADAEIGFDADGDGTIDETVNGFSHFFGLNDFFVDNLNRGIHESDIMPAGFTASATTLRFVDGTSSLPLDPGGGGDVTLVIPAGSTLQEIAHAITTNVPNLTASVVPDGDGQRLRVSHDLGMDFEMSESAGGPLLSTVGMHNANVRAASQMTVREDLMQSPANVSRGTVQWDPDLGAAGEYFSSIGDDTAIQALAEQFNSGIAFDAAGGLGAVHSTFSQYGASILSRNASLADTNATQTEWQESLTNSLKNKSDNMRGVNLDEEMSDLIRFEQAYSAAARVITVIQGMFDALEQVI